MFEGKVALVTGGCRGIGAAITERLAAAGAHVAAGYNHGRDTAEALAEAQQAKGCSVSLHQGNVADHESCTRVVNEVLEQQGRIDYLINNAGINVDKTVRKMSVEDWHAVLRVNLSGGFYMVPPGSAGVNRRQARRLGASQAQAQAQTACPGEDDEGKGDSSASKDREEAGERKVMRGRPIGDMALGDTAELSRTASGGDVAEFLDSIGDHNPIHHDHEYAATTRFAKPIVPGMWTAGLVSAVLGTTLPGPGCIYVSQQITFTKPVFFGDVITARVEVVERIVERNRVRLKTTCVNQDGDQVMEGEALLSPPKTAVAYT